MKRTLLALAVFLLASGSILHAKVLTINKITTPPSIDGLDNDAIWHLQSSNLIDQKTTSSTTNITGEFKMCYDDNNVYLLVSVTDATPNNLGAATWQSDCVELFFAMDTANSVSYRIGDSQIRKVAAKTQANGAIDGTNVTNLIADNNFKIVQTDGTTYIQEWQIPIATLKQTANYNGKAFRFDLQIADNIGSTDRASNVFWNSSADNQWSTIQNQGLIILGGIPAVNNETVSLGSSWTFFKGNAAPAAGWNQTSFTETGWTTANAPFWYKTENSVTNGNVVTDMPNSYSTLYLRKKINISIPDTMMENVTFSIGCDDGYKIYINGALALEKNAPATTNNTDFAPTSVSTWTMESITLTATDSKLKFGDNTIAVIVYNSSLASSDLYFDAAISITKKELPMPKAPEATFSKPGGYYSSAFSLVLSSLTVGDTILYTIDCSDPATSASVKKGKSPLTIGIDPTNMTGRPNTPGVVIRAAVQKYGYSSRNSETRTYIFPVKLKTQAYPGAPWPNGDVNGQSLQYDVDAGMVTKYNTQIEASLKSIPTVSLVSDNANLFNSSTGIYVNAMLHGGNWERPASLELIETDNSEKFSTNIGVRVRGGYSRNNFNPKHAFRIFYRDEYGKKKLDYPIFGEEDAVQEFDKFDLRCAQNYSWSLDGSDKMTYVQDETCSDIQGQMGRTHTHRRYCHVFLNGLYWGLYEFQERAEAGFAADYMGGKKDNYDVIKVATDNGMNLEATDGDMNMYKNLYALTNTGFSSMANYYKLQGLNSNGSIDTTLNALADVDNLIDYMMDIFYSGNFDSPLSIWGNNNMPNNYYAIKNKKHKRQGFFFVIHDAEHTFNYISGSANENQKGVNEDRVNLEDAGMEQPSAVERFTAQWLHYKLKDNPEYCIKFADRVYKEFYNGGLFTPVPVEANIRKRASQIDKAIISESIRWGHGWLNREDHWLPAIENTVSEFVDVRTPIVIAQLKSAGLVPSVSPVKVSVNDKNLALPEFLLSTTVAVKLDISDANGVIYYTLDGSDPRLVGGASNPKAATISSGSTFNVAYPLILKTRVKVGTEWSAIREILFTNTQNRENIRITEIQYSPIDLNAASAKNMEFIELKNVGDKGVDLGGCRLDSAVKYKFPKGTIVPPNGFVVIASDRNDFEYVYRVKATGIFSGNLSNDGERIVLVDENNNKLIDMEYGITAPWPIKPNGSGFSLVAKEAKPANTPNNSDYWMPSRLIFGSPFSDDSAYVEPPLNIENEQIFCKIYPNPVSEQLFVDISESKLVSIQISDLSGRKLFAKNISNPISTIEVNFNQLNIKPGIYMVNVVSRVNTWQQKIVYQK